MKRVLLALFVVAGMAVPTAQAGLDIDFGAAVRIGDDNDLFLSVSARYFDEDRGSIDRLALRYRNPDDLTVALFVARRSGKSADAVHRLRTDGLSWWDISLRFGMPMDVWFVPVRRDPGPPYGKAYGHWKHHKRNRHHAVVLTDADVRNLVAVRMLHEYYGVSVDVAMEWRSSGHDVRILVSDEYGKRHRHKDVSTAKNKNKNKGKGSGKKKHKK
jgi:hypothetical protein